MVRLDFNVKKTFELGSARFKFLPFIGDQNLAAPMKREKTLEKS